MIYRIAIVDDRPQAMQLLAEEMQLSGETELVFTASNGEIFLEKLRELSPEQYPHVVLMDIDMPVMDGIEAVRRSSALYPGIRYIMLTVFDDDDKLFEAIRAGADGYLLKEERANFILTSIKEVVEEQGAPMSPRIARKTLNLLLKYEAPKPPDTVVNTALSEREIQILQSMVEGLDYRQIGEKLFISPFTVRNHITKIYGKLHVTSKAQAVNLAVKNRWV